MIQCMSRTRGGGGGEGDTDMKGGECSSSGLKE